jgi:uncharacterized protein YdeI (YjbR/CyaY-like superfamily)
MNDAEKVNEFMNKLEHPLKTEIEAVRKIIMNANSKIQERIKWNAPSYYFKKDMAAFNPRAKDYVHLIFIFHDGIMINDRSGILEGDYKDRRMVKLYDMADVMSKKAALQKLVNDWITLVDT